jgi:hypothetical protein
MSPPASAPASASDSWALRAELPALAALLAVAAVNGALLLLGHRTYFAQPDDTGQFWAWYQKAASVIHSGALPLWDANTLAGHSFVGEAQTGVFYPLNLIWLAVLGSAAGIGTRRLDLLVVVHLLIASTGFYALARSFRVGRLAAVIAGVVFAYTGVVFARTVAQTAIFFGLALVPWAVFFAHRQLETARLRFAVGAGAAVGLGVLAGHFQPPFHALLLIGLLYVLTPGLRPELPARARGLGTTLGVAALVALPQLVYTLPYLGRAYRFTGETAPTPPGGTVSFTTFSQLYSAGPDSALSLIDPSRYPVADANELFVGLAGLVVLLVGVGLWRRVRAQAGRYALPLCAAVVVGALAMLGQWTLFARVLYALPLVSQVRELARYSIMVHVGLCLVLAFTLQAIGAGWRPGRRFVAIAAAGGLVVADGIYLAADRAPDGTRWFGVQVLLGGLVLVVLASGARWRRVPVLALVGALVAGAALANGTRVLPRTSSPLYPARYFARTPVITYVERACAGHRTLLLDDALPRNIGDVFRGIRTQNGYGATGQSSWWELTSTSSYTGPAQTRLLDLRCIVARNPIAVAGYHVGLHDAGAGITVYVDDTTSPVNTPALQPVAATTLHLSDRDVRYAVDLPRPTTVVVSAIVYPGWHLRVDGVGRDGQSLRVGGVPVFPEVALGPGRHVLDYSWSGWPA